MGYAVVVGTSSCYVSPAGNDAWSGRLPEPNRAGTDGPLATVSRALRRGHGRVLLRGGAYPPLCMDREEAGCLIGAYPGERPCLAGAEITADNVRLEGLGITGDVTISGEGNRLYACRVGGRLTARGSDHRILACIVEGGAILDGDSLLLSDCILRGGEAGVRVSGRHCQVRQNAVSGSLTGIMLTVDAGAIIEHNVVTDVNIGLWLHEPWPGTRARGNVIRRTRIGMHLADCVAILIEDNLVEAESLAWCQQGGRDNLLRNNSLSGGIACEAPGPIRPAILEGNLLRGCRAWDDRALARRNSRLLHAEGCLREDDPALAYGFGPLDPALAGPRLDGVLPRSADDWPAEPESLDPAVRCCLQSNEPGAYTLTVENRGLLPVMGEVVLRVTPAEAGVLHGDTALPYALLPGECGELTGSVTFHADCRCLLLETLPRGEGILPTAVYLTRE